MLKNFVANTTENSDVTVCTASSGTELSIMSIMLNGGENGGEVTLNFSTGFSAGFSVDAGDTIVLDNKINMPAGASFTSPRFCNGIGSGVGSFLPRCCSITF